MKVQGATSELASNVGALPANNLTPLPGQAVFAQPAPNNPVLRRLLSKDKSYREHYELSFPSADPLQSPLGQQVMVQLRTPRKKSRGGIVFSAETRDAEKWNTQIGLVIAVGPVAFHRRDTLALWPEGAWCRPGDFIRTPLHGGDKWEVPVEGQDDGALFAFFRDLDLLGMVTGDPLSIKAYVG